MATSSAISNELVDIVLALEMRHLRLSYLRQPTFTRDSVNVTGTAELHVTAFH